MAKDVKLNYYSAISTEEYDRAIAYVRERVPEDLIKEVGWLPSTNQFGNPIDTYTFVFVAECTVMQEVTKLLSVPCQLLN